jgi:hypothetical protein
MRIALTRTQYDSEIKRQLQALLGPDGAERALAAQYPKSRIEAVRELHHRGVALDDFWPAEGYTADDVDMICDVLGQAAGGLLTAEAVEARSAGMTLFAYRQAQAAGGDDHADAGGDDQPDAGGDDQPDDVGYCDRWS